VRYRTAKVTVNFENTDGFKAELQGEMSE